MSRFRRSIATGLGALVCVSAIGLTAVAVAAAMPIRPVAATQGTSQVGPYKVTLHGQSGPGVAGGDVTTYHFNFGKTTSYGMMTPTGTVGSCPGSQASCDGVPATQAVSARVSNLAPCTTYHYRLISKNPMGQTLGQDQTVLTPAAAPLASAPGSPYMVTHGMNFVIELNVNYRLNVMITINRGGQTVSSFNPGAKGPHHVMITLRAPMTPSVYNLQITLTSNCGTYTKNKQLLVF
jgi:hypothetical protein